jgi:hypothetical protein
VADCALPFSELFFLSDPPSLFFPDASVCAALLWASACSFEILRSLLIWFPFESV